ncbi:hypothetical protein [Pseudomonas protegens]|uniref:hypothetical protein n=1 Tax=Pseudomonas protegens TaxID=380021 RepID=UPI001F07B7C7|nr:hypothetical protein [Pseudomonas protegens]
MTEYHADKDGVAVTTAEGERFTGRYMIDCGARARRSRPSSSSAKSRVASRRTRAASKHMLGVKPFDDIFRSRGSAGAGTRGPCTTLTGGWLWVIPFNNHPRSTNNLVSVGLQLDPRVYPKTDISAQQEFDEFLARFPSIGAQFRDARAGARLGQDRPPAVLVERLRRRPLLLMLHANGFIDPFSPGAREHR